MSQPDWYTFMLNCTACMNSCACVTLSAPLRTASSPVTSSSFGAKPAKSFSTTIHADAVPSATGDVAVSSTFSGTQYP
jgi:hypothetical protein